MTQEQLLATFAALGHPQRLRIIVGLSEGRVHVSELARRLQLSRPLLYMHLAWLEKAHLVVGHLELSSDGKAHKFFELTPFDIRVNAETINTALATDGQDGETQPVKDDTP